ncbi:hypothetical protein ACWDE9_29140 [Streptomyces olivaceoviridis]
MTRRERIRGGGTAGLVLAPHLFGRGALAGVAAPRHLGLGGESRGVGCPPTDLSGRRRG